MKRIIPVILISALTLSFVGCDMQDDSRRDEDDEEVVLSEEEMLQEATDLSIEALYNAADNNEVRAESTYLDNYYTVMGYVSDIDDEEIRLSSLTDRGYIDVTLPSDDIIDLDSNQVITVVGRLSDLDEMDVAYLVDDELTVEAEVGWTSIMVTSGYGTRADRRGVFYLTLAGGEQVICEFASSETGIHTYGTTGTALHPGTFDTLKINDVEVYEGDRFELSGTAYYVNGTPYDYIEFDYGSTVTPVD